MALSATKKTRWESVAPDHPWWPDAQKSLDGNGTRLGTNIDVALNYHMAHPRGQIMW